MASFFEYLNLAYILLTGVTILVHAIAPLTTQWTGDDKLARLLVKFQARLTSRALLPKKGDE